MSSNVQKQCARGSLPSFAKASKGKEKPRLCGVIQDSQEDAYCTHDNIPLVFRLYGKLFLMNIFLLISLGNEREINKKVYPNTSKCIFYASLFVLSTREYRYFHVCNNAVLNKQEKG